MYLSDCFFDYNYAVIPLDDVDIYHGVKSVCFKPFKTFKESVYYCRHLARRSIFYSCDGLYPAYLEKPSLHYAIVKCGFSGLSISNYYSFHFNEHGGFSMVSIIGSRYYIRYL